MYQKLCKFHWLVRSSDYSHANRNKNGPIPNLSLLLGDDLLKRWSCVEHVSPINTQVNGNIMVTMEDSDGPSRLPR